MGWRVSLAAQIESVVHLRGREVTVHKSYRRALRTWPSRAQALWGRPWGKTQLVTAGPGLRQLV
jgi:hypothetical protein